MNKILIVYIATGKYKNYFNRFIKSLNAYFYPYTEKRLITVSDKKISKYNLFINHNPWPIPALLKFHYIKNAIDLGLKIDKNFTHVFYFNANVVFLDLINKHFVNKGLIAVPHHMWEWRNHDYLSFTNDKVVNKDNNAFIKGRYTYCNSGVLGGNINKLSKACDTIIDWTNYDLAHGKIAYWHDESYWNRYVNENNVKIIDQCYSFAEDFPQETFFIKGKPKIMYSKADLTSIDKDRYFE